MGRMFRDAVSRIGVSGMALVVLFAAYVLLLAVLMIVVPLTAAR